ncbi:MAG TPA: DUF2341 domain-containing protein [Acidobacteriota bacterium]|nr:DUF2341 domain-containing protein [Acidobacteriota bacterium]
MLRKTSISMKYACFFTFLLLSFLGFSTLISQPIEKSVQAAAPKAFQTWLNRCALTVTSTNSSPVTGYQVLVTLNPGNFNYANANLDGSDIRFATSPTAPPFDLNYFLESWNPGGTSRIWVNLPAIPANGTVTIYLFYTNPAATSASSFAATFPNAFVSTGTDTLTGTQTFDWFEVQAGHTLNIGAGQILSITARNVIVAGTINGVGSGNQAPGINTNGTGPGGGTTSTNSGSGGGSYGGTGGTGGLDSGDTPGTGGPTYGTQTGTDIDMGSSGGSGTGVSTGGSGGGAISILADQITVSGTIAVTGGTPLSDGTGRGGGGGSGGAILIQGFLVTNSGDLIANGSNGATGTSTANDSGGGGGGGRIKLFAENLTNTGTFSVTGGIGGPFGTQAPGQPGTDGTTHTDTFDFPQITAGNPTGCGLGLLVADTQNHRIQQFDGTDWSVLLGTGVAGTASTQLRLPEAAVISLDGTRIYVADTGNNRIQWSTDSGTNWQTFASLGAGFNQVRAPQGLAIDSDGNLYVSDTGNGRVLRFNGGNPGFAVVIASTGTASGQVGSPHGLAINSAFTLFVTDESNSRILRITTANTVNVSTSGSVIATLGTALNRVKNPQDVALDASGILYIADTGNSRILRWVNANPNNSTAVALIGSQLGQVNRAEGVTVVTFTTGPFSGQPVLVVSDTSNNRVQGRLVSGGGWSLLGAPNNLGSAPGQFRTPSKL